MTVTVYRSGDTSAPTLTGENGSFKNLLNKCLVTGYGSKTAAGWTMPYYPNDLACFKAGGGNQPVLAINDGAGFGGGAKEVQVRGYLTMSAYNTGTDPFPSAAQLANACFMAKSATADNTQRPWILVADNKRFYISIQYTANNYAAYFFGDIRSYAATDLYCSVLLANPGANNIYGASYGVGSASTAANTTVGGCYIARNYNGEGTSQTVGVVASALQSTGGHTLGGSGLVYPNPTDNGIFMQPVFIKNEDYKLRGWMPGLWSPQHNKPLAHGDTFGGVGGMTGKTFIALNCCDTSGQIFIETSNTWDS